VGPQKGAGEGMLGGEGARKEWVEPRDRSRREIPIAHLRPLCPFRLLREGRPRSILSPSLLPSRSPALASSPPSETASSRSTCTRRTRAMLDPPLPPLQVTSSAPSLLTCGRRVRRLRRDGHAQIIVVVGGGALSTNAPPGPSRATGRAAADRTCRCRSEGSLHVAGSRRHRNRPRCHRSRSNAARGPCWRGGQRWWWLLMLRRPTCSGSERERRHGRRGTHYSLWRWLR